MARRDVILVGTSAGGVEALSALVRELPANLPATLVAVLHLPRSGTSVLADILARSTQLTVSRARDGVRFEHGHVHVAPSDHHVLVQPNGLRLSHGPRVNGHRPAIDPLFFSAARWLGPRAMGVVLSGTLDDGTSGVVAMRRAGAITMAQSPDEALHTGMPVNAIAAGVDLVGTIAEIAAHIVRLAGEEVAETAPQHPHVSAVDDDPAAMLSGSPEHDAIPTNDASGFTCPECHGALWEIRNGEHSHYACRTGHAFGIQSLLSAQSETIEQAIWAGYRALAEQAALARRLAARARQRGLAKMAIDYEERERESLDSARKLRAVLSRGELGAEAQSNEQ